MLTKHLNGTRVGSGTQIDFTAKGVTATDDGSKTTYDFTPVINVVEVTLTTAQMLAARATPPTLVAAPGAGYVLEFLGATFIYDYASAYTESTDNAVIRFTDGSGAIASTTLETTGLLDATSDQIRTLKPITTDITPVANSPLVFHNTGDGEWGGTGSPVRIRVAYRVHPTGL
jgi:hypothetical protein